MYNDDTIDAYILGKLPTEEKNSFEAALTKDNGLQQLVNERKELILVAKLVGAAARKKELKQLITEAEAKDNDTQQEHTTQTTENNTAPTENPKQTTGKLVKIMPFLLAAACIAALCYLFIFQTTPELDPLFKEFYSPYSISVRSTDGSVTPKEKAYQLYANKNYADALPILSKLSPESQEMQLMVGISQLETGNPDAALAQFKGLIAQNSELYIDHAKWYAALTLIQLNKKAESKTLLNQLANQTEYIDKANLLLVKLRRE